MPVFSPTGFDAEFYGEPLGYPIGLPMRSQERMVGNYSHHDSLFPTRAVAAAARPFPLQRATEELAVSYTYTGVTYTIPDYLARNPTTGLLIARGDAILFEHYQYGRTDHDRFLSQSMAETVTSMLIGIAMAEGSIRSVDDLAQTYVPELTGTELGRTPLRSLLHMASGVAFRQSDDGADAASGDAKLNRALFSGAGPIAAVAQFNTRLAPPDTLWNYANLDTEVLGLVVAHATHMTLAEYLQTRIWQPMEAEADAKWGIDDSGQEIAYAGFNATLRDYARFGLLLAHDGELNGKQIIPRRWVLEATKPVDRGAFLLDKGEHPWGYGYQAWLMPGPRRTFFLSGLEGQKIFIDPESKLVLVHTAVRRLGDPRGATLVALWLSILAHASRD